MLCDVICGVRERHETAESIIILRLDVEKQQKQFVFNIYKHLNTVCFFLQFSLQYICMFVYSA